MTNRKPTAPKKKKKSASKKKAPVAVDVFESDPKLQRYDDHIHFEGARLPDLRAVANEPFASMFLDRPVKTAPHLHEFLDACRTLRELSVHNPTTLDPAPTKSRVETLEIRGSSAKRLAFLRGFPRLEVLTFGFRGSRGITDLAELRHTPRLRRLFATGHAARSLAPLASLAQLREYIGESTKALRGLDGLESCTKLRHVNVNLAPIDTVAPLAGAKKLLALKIRGTKVRSLEPLFGAKKLETLFAEKTPLRSIDGIAKGLPGLRLLWLHSTKIVDLAPLASLRSLLELDIGGMPAKDFRALADMPNLKHVDLFQTSFADLDVLEAMPNLVSARVEKTKIKKQDPRVRKLNASLRKRHGREAGLYFSSKLPFSKLGPTEAAFSGTSEEELEHSLPLLR